MQTVILNTNHGPITIELDDEHAPKTVENFLSYANEGFYNNTVFHRVINGFMIQGGGFEPGMKQKPTKAQIKNEANNGLKNTTGTIAMARTSVANSATSQFYINTIDNTGLDYKSNSSPGYAVFGSVVDGMDVIDSIEKAHTFSVTASSVSYPNLPFPFLISIYSAQVYTPTATQTVTSHTTSKNAYGVSMV